MKLTEETKQKIIDILDSDEFKVTLYDGLNEEKRIELGQFYTPASICIDMLEKFKTDTFENKDILDPCCGSGNLLIAMLIAGADSHRIYGNDWDNEAVKLCRKRINRACDILGKEHIEPWQIHRGDATVAFCCTEFGPDYKDKLIDYWYDTSNSLASMLDPDHQQIEAWLETWQLEFLQGVD